MKVILLGDTHFLPNRASPIFQAYFDKFYKFFFEYTQKHDIKTVIQLGDLYDVRREVQFTTIKWVNENFYSPLEDQGIQFSVICGNHDVLYKNTNKINSVSLLCPSDSLIVDLVPHSITIGSASFDLFPWINESNLEITKKFIENSTSDYAIGHFEFSGFPMYPGTIAETGMDHKMFSKYKEVYSGHYHTISLPTSDCNILYTGTPCELNWADCSDPKGFWVLDTETGLREHIRNPYTLFEKISYTEDMVYDFTTVTEKYVKIIVLDKKDQGKFDKFLDNINLNRPHDVKVIESSLSEVVSDAVLLTDLLSTQSMISTVLDNLDVQVDKSKLKLRVLELYAEAEQLNKTL